MPRILPTPTPEDIEVALLAMRKGTSAYGRWARMEVDSPETLREQNAEAARLWWVDIVDPTNTVELAIGGGTNLVAAAAVAWINPCVGAWWRHRSLSDEDYATVPRVVPEGWQFEMHARPARPLLRAIESSRDC